MNSKSSEHRGSDVMADNPETSDKLLKRLEANCFEDRARELNDLADEFRRGLPVSRLRPALRSKDIEVIEMAIWIACELGSRAVPLVDDIIPLATNTALLNSKHRICDICLLSIPCDTRLLPAVSEFLIDESWFVRFFAMRVFLKLEEQILFACLEQIESKISEKKGIEDFANTDNIHKRTEDFSRLTSMMWLIFCFKK